MSTYCGVLFQGFQKSFPTVAIALISWLLFPSLALSKPGVTYHGRILKPNGSALESSQVRFKLQIRSPGAENCLLYEEEQTKNLAGSGGVFSITLNDGSGLRGVADEFASGQRLSLQRVFQNRPGLPTTLSNCDSGSSYQPDSNDGRWLVVSFKDATMTAWEPMPAQMINYVPFALEATSLAGFTPQNFLRVEDLSGAPGAATAFSGTQMSELVSLITGTSTLYARANQLGGVSLPTLSSGQSLQWNGTGWSAVNTVSMESDPTVQAFAKAALPNCANGEVLRSNGTAFACATDITSGAATDATTSAKGVVQISPTGGISVSGGVLSLPDQGSITAGSSYSKVTIDAKGRVTAGTTLSETDVPSITSAWAGTIDGSKVSGTIGGSTALSTSGAITTGGSVGGRAFNVFDADTNKITLLAPALSADYSLTLPSALPTSNGQLLSADTLGQLSWIAPASNSVAGSSLDDGKIWVGNGSNVANAVSPTGDVSMTNSGLFSVTKIRGQSVAAIPPVVGQVLRFSSSNAWEAANVSVSDLKKSDGTLQFGSASCTAGQTLNWSSLTDTFACVSISIVNTQVSGLGNASTKDYGMAAGHLVELDSGGKIPASLLPSGMSTQWTTSGANIHYTSGNVGIGTSSPAQLLHVAGLARLTPVAISSGAAGDFGFDSADSNKLKFHNGTAWQTVNTGGGGSGDFLANGSVNMTGSLKVVDGTIAAPGLAFASDTNTGIFKPAGNTIGFSAGGAERMRLNSTGLVVEAAISLRNTTTPSATSNYAKFYMKSGRPYFFDDASVESKVYNSSDAIVGVQGTSGAPAFSFLGDTNTGMYRHGTNSIGFTVAAVNRFNLDSNAFQSPNVGASYITSANGVASAPTYAFTGDLDSGMWRPAADTIAFSTAGTERVRINSDGSIGIGTGSPSEKLHVVGNLRVQGSTDCTLGNGSGGTSCSSDLRLKTNIQEIANPLEKLLSLRGVEFDWNEKSQNPGRHDIGVIAQDVEKQFPTAVIEDSKTGFKKVDYAVLVAPVIGALKELRRRLVELSGSSDLHSKELEFVNARVSQLEFLLTAKNEEIFRLKADYDKQKIENAEMKVRIEKIELILTSK